LFDERTGPLGSLREHDFEQLPLKVCQAQVSNPMAIQALGSPVIATAVAIDFAQARQRATQRACELYAASVVNRRRVAVQGGGGAAADEVWSYDLGAGTARTIRAGLVFPVLEGVPASHDTAPGLASGASWSEAVARGLLAHCTRLTIAELAPARTPFSLIELDSMPRTGNTARYMRLLAIAGESLSIYDVTGSLEVPTLAACLGDQTVCYVSGFEIPQAVEIAFEHAVQAYQARINDQPAYAPREVPALPRDLRGSGVTAHRSGPAPSWSELQDLLVRQLARAGWRPVVALLDHDPVIETVLPYLVNVVLLPAGGD